MRKLFINPRLFIIRKYGTSPPLMNIGIRKKVISAFLKRRSFLIRAYAPAAVASRITVVRMTVIYIEKIKAPKISEF